MGNSEAVKDLSVEKSYEICWSCLLPFIMCESDFNPLPLLDVHKQRHWFSVEEVTATIVQCKWVFKMLENARWNKKNLKKNINLTSSVNSLIRGHCTVWQLERGEKAKINGQKQWTANHHFYRVTQHAWQCRLLQLTAYFFFFSYNA